MVAPIRVSYQCARVLSTIRAYANGREWKRTNPSQPIPQILTRGVSDHNPKELRIARTSTRVEYEKFVSVRCFPIHSHKRRVVLSSFRRWFPMTFHTAPFFPHRRNKDGSFNSICLKCFATVASHMTEEELQEKDNNHVCVKSVLSERGNHVSLIHNENETR
jgi:hypothetical protein